MVPRNLRPLRELVFAHAIDGGHATSISGLWLHRADAPVLAKKTSTHSVTLAAIVQGHKQVAFSDRVLVYSPGDYLLVTGEQRFSATIAEASPEVPYLSMSLRLPPEAVVNALLELADAGDDAHSEDPPAVVSKLDAKLTNALTRLLQTLEDPVERRFLSPLIIREIIFRLLRNDSAAALRRAAHRQDGRIHKALTYMRGHAHERLTVDSIARRVAMSPSHFAHRFREIVRVSPMQFVRHVRLHRARQLLLSDGGAAAEIAGEVGYASASHFSRDFKSHFGAPPRTYAQRFRGTH